MTAALDLFAGLDAHILARVDERLDERLEELCRSPWMGVKEAAEYLRVGTSRIYKLTAAGEIPHSKQDGRLYFDRDEVDAWVREGHRGPNVEVSRRSVETVNPDIVAELFEEIVSTPTPEAV
jgi:excisionase family DNA binding protein